jgi:hypothetical protein
MAVTPGKKQFGLRFMKTVRRAAIKAAKFIYRKKQWGLAAQEAD